LSIEELSNFKLPSTDDCVLWLWTTHKFLPDAFNLLKLWYFEYKITMVWDKEKLGMGAWLRCQSEFCLLCIKGKPQWNLTNERDIIRVARKEHSRKPHEFYSMVKKLCPGKRIDIFGREKRDGFDGWGDQSAV
jgi:N6-adenosine-specific RNA methylase IME4